MRGVTKKTLVTKRGVSGGIPPVSAQKPSNVWGVYMDVKVFTLAFSEERQGFITDELDIFVKNRKVKNVYEHFFERNGNHYWAVMIFSEPINTRQTATVLTEPQQRFYNMLKDWRLRRAKQDGTQAYLILHDKQLVDIVFAIPQTENALTKIRGIGEQKAQKYGPEIIGVVKAWQLENRSAKK